MSQGSQKPWAKLLVLVMFVSALVGLMLFSTTTGVSAGNGTADEILVFNKGTKSSPYTITKSMSGFIMEVPSGPANANWVTGQYAGFAGGTL